VSSRRARRLAAGGGTPLPIAPLAIIGIAFLAFPTVALMIRAPWSSIAAIYRSNDFSSALRISLITSLEAVAVSLVLGVPLAWVLARVDFPGRSLVRAMVALPLVLPPVVAGVALFFALGRNGVLGQYLYDWFGVQLSFTQHGIVIAQAFVAMPFLVVTLEGGFRSVDGGLEEAAATLGASRWRVFTRVTMRLVAPSLAAGTVLCWARSLGEFGATLLFGGNNPGVTRTGPTAVLSAFNNRPEDAVALSLPLLFVALAILVCLRDSWLGRPATR
jgi:molybdate transport system permease protein